MSTPHPPSKRPWKMLQQARDAVVDSIRRITGWRSQAKGYANVEGGNFEEHDSGNQCDERYALIPTSEQEQDKDEPNQNKNHPSPVPLRLRTWPLGTPNPAPALGLIYYDERKRKTTVLAE